MTLRGIMRKDVLLLNGGGGSGSWPALVSKFMEKAARRTSIDSVL